MPDRSGTPRGAPPPAGDTAAPAARQQVFPGDSELARLMRALDWSQTPLGAVEGWPQALKTCVYILLTSRQPMWLGWGEQLTYLYNDPYKAIIGGKHPWALGRPTAEVWREIWEDIRPRIATTMQGKEGTYDEALLLIMERHGYQEETYYTFSYSPVPDERGGVGGLFCANTDDTQRVISERQLALLRELAASTVDTRTVADACLRSARALQSNPRDLPFALLYLVETDQTGERRCVLAGAANISVGDPAAPETITLDAAADAPVWPLAAALDQNAPRLIDGIDVHFSNLPLGAWDRAPRQAVALPIAPAGETGHAGVLVVGLNPYRRFDEDYRRFLELVAGQIAAAIGNAQTYEEERRRAEALAELDRAKTAFFSNVSHEFRTPLTLLLGPVEDLLAGAAGPLAPRQHEELTVAHRNSLRLLRLVNTLLDFSRIEAGRVQAAYEPTDLARLTTELASSFDSAITRAGLCLVVDCPPLPASVAVYVDRDMWEKIVLNLLSNALKFTFAGEIGVALHVRADGHAVTLTVRDTGTGIPAEELPRLFERFHRVQGARARTHEGTGIGLALVNELARLHGGSVAVESTVGAGTTFTVTIPTGKAHLPPERIGAARTRASTATGAAPYVEEALRWLPGQAAGPAEPRGEDGPLAALSLREAPPSQHATGPAPRILLADDSADMRAYVARLLAQRYDVEAVADGATALAAARAHPPDLVLSDVMMPELDGFALLRELRADPRLRTIPVILLSARAGEEATVEGVEAGADDYLVKPFAARELLARVGAHLELARVRAEAAERERAARERAEALAEENARLYRAAQEQTQIHVELNAALRETAEERDRALAAADAERRRLQELFVQAPALIAVLRGPDHVYELANPLYVQSIGNRQILHQPIRAALPELAGQGVFELLDQVYSTGERFVGSEVRVLLDRSGDQSRDEVYYNFVYEPLRDAAGAVDGIFVHAVEITEQVRARQAVEAEMAVRERAEVLLGGQRSILELIARGQSLGTTLTALARFIEGQISGALCSILLLDRDGLHLRHGAGPSLPEAFNRAIDGLAIGPSVGSCGTAAFRNEPVVVTDIAADPLWTNFRALALTHGLRACWSTPVRGPDGAVLGTFAMYYREPRGPSEYERSLVDVLTYLAGIAIERHRREEERTEILARERTARAEAETGRARLQQVLDLLPAGVVIADAEGRFTMGNQAARAILGMEIVGLALPRTELEPYQAYGARRLDGTPFPAAELPHQRAVLRGETVRDVRFFLRNAQTGREIPVLASSAPLADAAGQPAGGVVVFQDITAIYDLEQQKDAFLSAAAHDLQQPVAAIRGYAQLLRRRLGRGAPPDRERLLTTLAAVEDATSRLADQTAELLDVSRLQMGRPLALERAPTDLFALVREAVDAYRTSGDGRAWRVEAAVDRLEANVDAARLRRVLDNLLANAAKFSDPATEVVIGITREAGVDGEWAVLTVADHGIGIPAADLPHIFERFYRGGNAAGRIAGTGVGLAGARQIVERHGGAITVESVEGAGSTFTVRLPLG